MSGRIRIKNCGLRDELSIHAAIGSGADFLGFVIHPASPRHIEPAAITPLIKGVPPQVAIVAVMVAPSDDQLNALFAHLRPHYLQLHGDVPPARLAAIRSHAGLPVIQAVAIGSAEDVKAAQHAEAVADHVLLDTKHLDLQGGTGESFDWHLLAQARFRKDWFLSGGLHAGNITEALRISGAPMVDVSSGIEQARGVKDPQKIVAFNQLAGQFS